MKKNIAMRVAAILFILTMISTCAFSTTFAKYVTSDSASDSARVAKWGVVVDVTGDDAFGEKYDNQISSTGTKVVSATSGQNVLAPGTNGTLATLDITGSPEVMVNIDVIVDLEITNWTVESAEYCPLVFVVTTDGTPVTFKIDLSDDTIDTIDELETKIEDAYKAVIKSNVPANSDLKKSVYTTWSWGYEPVAGTVQSDAKDTVLGNWQLNGKPEPKISMSLTVTVTQVD